MTRKFAVCDVPRGGGKARAGGAALFDGAERIELLHRYGDFITSLGGLYATAPDMNTSERDMDVIAERCEYVFCRSAEQRRLRLDRARDRARRLLRHPQRRASAVTCGACACSSRASARSARSWRASSTAAGADVLVSDVDPSRRRSGSRSTPRT